MKDWRKIADGIIQEHSEMKQVGGNKWCLCLDAQALSIGIADALQDVARIAESGTVSYGPAPGKPVLVSDKWLEDLNNKLAQITQRVNQLDGQQRGMGDIVTPAVARLTEHRRLIDDLDKRLVAVEQSAYASRNYISRLEAGAEKVLKGEGSNAGG